MATANDKLQDESIAHAIWIARYSTSVANRMIKILNDSDAELTARLLVAMDSLDADSFTVSRLEALLVVSGLSIARLCSQCTPDYLMNCSNSLSTKQAFS
jgi:hypothetical protein